MSPNRSRRILRRSETKKSPTPVAKASKDKSGKKHKAPATAEKFPIAIPHAKLANDKSQNKTDAFPKEKKSPTPVPKAKAARKSRPATITNRRTHRSPPTLVRQSQNLRTKRRQRQSLRRARRLSAARNQSGITRLHPNRNPRRKKPRKFQAKRRRREIRIDAKRRGNTKTGKDAAAPYRRAHCRIRAANTSPERSDLRCRRPRPLPVKSCAPCSRRASSGCDRKVRYRGRSGLRASAVASAERGFWPWSRFEQLSLSHAIRDRRDPTRASETASLAIHCGA